MAVEGSSSREGVFPTNHPGLKEKREKRSPRILGGFLEISQKFGHPSALCSGEEGKDSPGKWRLIQIPSAKRWETKNVVYCDGKDLFMRMEVGIGDLGMILGNTNEPELN